MLYVCKGTMAAQDPSIACRRLCARIRKVIAAHGSPIPFLRRGSRDELRAATGDELPALKFSDGTVITHSKSILDWLSGAMSEPSVRFDSPFSDSARR